MSTASTAPMEPAISEPVFLTLGETARYFRVSENTIRNWMLIPGKLPAPRRFGQRYLFNAREIKAMAGA